MSRDSGSPHCVFSAFCFFSLLVHKSPYLSPGMRVPHVTVCVILAASIPQPLSSLNLHAVFPIFTWPSPTHCSYSKESS